MESSHVGAEKLAEATNIKVHTIKNYLRDTTPTLEALITLADYFAVPLDFIAGRCDEALSREVLEDYGKHFMELRRAPYEAYLLKCATGREPMFCDDKIEAPWPYNLLDAVFRSIDDTKGIGDTDYVSSADKQSKLSIELSTLKSDAYPVNSLVDMNNLIQGGYIDGNTGLFVPGTSSGRGAEF